MDKKFYGPENLYAQLESAFYQQNFQAIKKLAESCSDDETKTLFINYVRRSRDARILNSILSYFSFSDELKAQALFIITLFDNLPVLESLLEKAEFKSKHLLFYAFRSNADVIIQYLMAEKKGFDIFDRKGCFNTLLMAVKRGYSVEAIALIDVFEKKGLDVFNDMNNSSKGLNWRQFWEAGFQSVAIEFLELLVAKGADIDGIIDAEKKLTIIHLAINEREPKLLEFLAKKGAKLNFDENQISAGFVSPLETLINLCCTCELDFDFLSKGTKILVKYGADPNVFNRKKMKIEKFVKSKILDFFQKEKCWYDSAYDKEISKEEAITLARAAIRKSIKEGLSSQNKLKLEE